MWHKVNIYMQYYFIPKDRIHLWQILKLIGIGFMNSTEHSNNLAKQYDRGKN